MEATSRNTADSIFSRQNDAFLLQCQVAQRSEYSHAKLVARWKTYLTVSFAVLSVLASVLDIDWLTAVSSLLAVVLLIFNKYSDEYIMTRKKHAASVQQYIDATLYAAAIDSNVSDWGDVPSQSDLAVSVSEYENADTSAVFCNQNGDLACVTEFLGFCHGFFIGNYAVFGQEIFVAAQNSFAVA